MKSGLEFLNRLDSAASTWLLSAGKEITFAEGDWLVERGTPGRAILMILSGVAIVSTTPNASGRIADLGPGDIVGEMAFLEESATSAYVVGREQGTALSIDCETLRAKLNEDAVFGQVFYRAFAQMLSARFRTREAAWLAVKPDQEGAAAATLWARVEPGLQSFKRLVQQADQQAIKNDAVPDGLAEQIQRSFTECEAFLDAVLGDSAQESEQTKAVIGARVQTELLPYLLMSENAERWYSKPRGYAGDFLSIAKMYDDEPRGTGRVGSVLDRCFLNLAAARAVKNRRALLSQEIQATLAMRGDRPARVTSLACGPAQELFDVYETLPDKAVLKSTLLDIDLLALAYVADRRDRKHLKRHMELLNENLVYLATGRRSAALDGQDLIYSIGLIDYFADAFVISLMDFIHGALRPGGRVILGNFHPRNVSKALMDYVLDWKLIHRTDEDMSRLFQASAFGRPCTRVLYEPQRINLFAECVRE
jgi:extracellular factor (EF) 3-hydroxypalmitic acid methyl ester biosynthesis protein